MPRPGRRRRRPPVSVTSGSRVLTMIDGVRQIARVTGVTYGPRGGTVMLDRAAGLLSTRDGASVAWEIEPSDPLHRLGTRVVQEACSRVSREVGDGTTTTAILIWAILRESRKWLAAGASPSELSHDLKMIGEAVDDLDPLGDLRVPVEDRELLVEIASSAGGGDEEAARGIVEALDMVGKDGMIVVEEGRGRGVEIIHKAGLESERGLESSDLAGVDGTRALDLPLVALVDATLDTVDDVRAVLEEASQFPHPLVIVSRGCHGKALQTIVANDRRLARSDGGTLEVVAVRAPGRTDRVRARLDDLAALTGATVVDPTIFPLRRFRSEHLGSAQHVIAARETTTFVAFDDAGPRIESRVEHLRREIDGRGGHDAEEIRTRIARLTDGFCIMRVGGCSQAEIRERRGKIEDALGAVRVAVEDGVVPGAGIAFLALVDWLPEVPVGEAARAVMAEAFREPIKVLARNAGAEPPVVLRRVLGASRANGRVGWAAGWDAAVDRVRDLREPPALCDPYAVVRAAVLTAISAAATMVLAEIAITKSRGASR